MRSFAPRGIWTESLLLLVLLFSVSAQAALAQTTAQVAGWNLAGFDPIPRQRAETFAEVIAELDPEVIALVEVNPDFMPGEIVAELNERDRCYERTLLEQRAHQNLAVLHKCDVRVSNPRFIPRSDDGNRGLRKALVVDVEMGDFDFFLIAVHLKAGRSSEARKTRTRQCRVIREFVKTLTEVAEKDVLIVGDYNMVPVEDDTNFAAMNFPEEDEATSFLRFVTTEELAAGTFSHISSGGRPGALLDGFAISTNHTGEYVPDSIEVVPMHERLHRILRTYARDVSDHLPVIASFRTTEDDDGE